MSNTNTVDQDGIFEPGEEFWILSQVSQLLEEDVKRSSMSSLSFDEIRNRAVYDLTREKVSQMEVDQGETYPWIETIGSKLDIVLSISDQALSAVEHILNNADSYYVGEE